MSTSEGVKYIGGILSLMLGNVMSRFGVFSTAGDIISTLGDLMIHVKEMIDKGYLFYIARVSGRQKIG